MRTKETQALAAKPTNEIIVYQPDETVRLEVCVQDESVWLTQAQMCELFQRDVSVVSRHIKNVFAEGEVDRKSNLHFLQIANSDRPVVVYSLNVIISVGYRVKSQRGTQFRIWATSVLREYLLRGFSVNARLNQLEDKVDRRLAQHDADIGELKDKVDFFVKTSLPPVQVHSGLFRSLVAEDRGAVAEGGLDARAEVAGAAEAAAFGHFGDRKG